MMNLIVVHPEKNGIKRVVNLRTKGEIYERCVKKCAHFTYTFENEAQICLKK